MWSTVKFDFMPRLVPDCALFATGMLNTGIWMEGDFALSLLGEYAENKSVPLKTSTFMGLALTYTGSHRDDLSAYLFPHVADNAMSIYDHGDKLFKLDEKWAKF